MMWVDFKIAHFMGYTLFMVFYLKHNMVSNPKMIHTWHKLNQVVK